MRGYRLDCVAIVHDHFGAHIRMENELNTDQCNLIEDYPMIGGNLVRLDVLREMYSTAAININQPPPQPRMGFRNMNY